MRLFVSFILEITCSFSFRALSAGVSVQQDLSDISGPGRTLNFRGPKPKATDWAAGNSVIHSSLFRSSITGCYK